MSDSKLLAENTIRRFMKLANVETMTDHFISENFKEENLEEEIDETEEINEEEELDEPEEAEMPDMEPGEEEMEMDLGEPEMDDEPGAADMSLTEEEAQLLISLGERLSAAMGEEEDDMEDDMEPDMDLEPEMDAPADEPAEVGAPDEEPGKAYMENMNSEEQQNLVNEILRRVTRRLVTARRK